MNSKSNLCTSLIVGATFFLALLSGCNTAAPTITSHADNTVNYAGYKSYMMLQPRGLPPVGNPAATPQLIRELRQEAGRAFDAKGLYKSPDAYADVLIMVHGGLQDKMEVRDAAFSYGRLGHGFAGHQEIDTHTEGTLYVDVIDAKTRELIWRGSAMAEVTKLPDAAQLKSAVQSIIARYPN